ncbi:MAG: hypothetical protein MJZ31_08735 [Bacteroidales bacterium]|nr:hypothetical protein [Bacteroidales bacterium]
MKKLKSIMLRVTNMILAGAIAALGFSSCDKGDDEDEERCLYGPAPSSYSVVDDDIEISE